MVGCQVQLSSMRAFSTGATASLRLSQNKTWRLEKFEIHVFSSSFCCILGEGETSTGRAEISRHQGDGNDLRSVMRMYTPGGEE